MAFYSSSNYFTITENKSVFGWTSKTSFSQLISHLIGWFFPLPAYAPVQKWWVSSCETAKLTLRGIHLLLNKYLVNILFSPTLYLSLVESQKVAQLRIVTFVYCSEHLLFRGCKSLLKIWSNLILSYHKKNFFFDFFFFSNFFLFFFHF